MQLVVEAAVEGGLERYSNELIDRDIRDHRRDHEEEALQPDQPAARAPKHPTHHGLLRLVAPGIGSPVLEMSRTRPPCRRRQTFCAAAPCIPRRGCGRPPASNPTRSRGSARD